MYKLSSWANGTFQDLGVLQSLSPRSINNRFSFYLVHDCTYEFYKLQLLETCAPVKILIIIKRINFLALTHIEESLKARCTL